MIISYNLGPKAKPFDEPKLIYDQNNKIFARDANIIDPGTNKRVLQWRGYRWISARVRVRAFLTSEGWNGGNQTYYTMTKLSSTGTKIAYHYETTHGIVGARSGWFSKQHTYTLDAVDALATKIQNVVHASSMQWATNWVCS